MLKSMGIVRKMDELGRVVLPGELRRAFALQVGDDLEVFVDEENLQVAFQKAAPSCLKCQSPKFLKEIKPGYYLCDECIKELLHEQ